MKEQNNEIKNENNRKNKTKTTEYGRKMLLKEKENLRNKTKRHVSKIKEYIGKIQKL